MVTQVDRDSVEVQAPDGQKWLYAREALVCAPSTEITSSMSAESDAAASTVNSAAAEAAAAELDDDAFDTDETDEDDAATEDRQRES